MYFPDTGRGTVGSPGGMKSLRLAVGRHYSGIIIYCPASFEE
jgi:hypothetical protein